MPARNGRSGASLWAITSYFNPLGYRRRRANYSIFQKKLGVPLLTVELGFGETFDLTDDDADILIQLRGGDVLWQKERLLNIALENLPRDCRYVAWVDCDVLFARADWGASAITVLEKNIIAQSFSRVHHLSRDWTDGDNPTAHVERTVESAASALAKNLCSPLKRAPNRNDNPSASGFSWVAHRDLLEKHGFYDACIIGGGDTALMCAVFGAFDIAIEYHQMNPAQRARYLAWAMPMHASIGGRVSHVEVEIYHLWHGEIVNRRAHERHLQLGPFNFDPATDIAVGADGSWRWATPKPDMHAYLKEHFVGRREDG